MILSLDVHGSDDMGKEESLIGHLSYNPKTAEGEDS